MKKSIFTILFLLPTFIFAQSALRKTSVYERVYVEAGICQPIGGLQQVVNTSFNFGFWFKTNIPERKNESIDLGFNLSVPDSNQPFRYEDEENVFRNRANVLFGMVGVRYNKNYPVSANGKCSLDVFPSLGYSFFGSRTVAMDGFDEIPDDKRESPTLSAVHVGQGVRVNFGNVGLQAQYQFTPYDWFSRRVDAIGSHSVTFGVVYRQ